MNGIENILSHIKTESEAECEAIERAAVAECERIRSEYAQRERDEYNRKKIEGKKAAELRLERLTELAELESKKQILKTKQEMLSAAFDHAAEKLTQLPDAEYIDLLARYVCAASLTGDETIILSPGDKDRIGSDLLEVANSAMSETGKTASLTLSEKTADIRGGFILSGGSIEVNCSVDALVAKIRKELTPEVASILYD